MRSIINVRSYRKRLLISTALTIVFWLGQPMQSKADPCQEGTNTGTCTLSGSLIVTQIDAENINTSQQGNLTITGDIASTITGNVYLTSLTTTGNGTLNLTNSNTLSINSVSLNNVTATGRTLSITGSGTSTINGAVSLAGLTSSNNTLNITNAGSITTTGNVTIKNINSNSSQGGTLTINGSGSSTISGSVYLGTLSASNASLNVTGTNTVKAGTVNLKNIGGTYMTLSITGPSASTITGDVTVQSLNVTGEGILTLTGDNTLSATSVSLNNVTATGRTLSITGSGTSTINGTVSLAELTAPAGTLNITSNGAVTAGSVTLKNVNSSGSRQGSLTVTGSGSSSIYGHVYLNSLSATNGTLNITGAYTVEANTVNLKNVTNASNNATLNIRGGSNTTSTISGTASVANLSSPYNTLNITGTVTTNTATVKNVNSDPGNGGSYQGTLNISDSASLTGSVYLKKLSATDADITLSGTLAAETVILGNVNYGNSTRGVLTITGDSSSPQSVLNGILNVSTFNVLNADANISFGSDFQYNGPINVGTDGAGVMIISRAYISSIGGGLSNGIADTRKYVLKAGTIPSVSGDAVMEDEDWAAQSPASFDFGNGIYQNGNGGIVLTGSSSLTESPIYVFERDSASSYGTIWDYSAYCASLPDGGYLVLTSGEVINRDPIGGNVSIYTGIFKGAVDIRKGNPVSYVATSKPQSTDVKKYHLTSTGNLNISGGEFYFSDTSQIKMYSSNVGTVNISGGQWHVGYDYNEGTHEAVSAGAGDTTVTGASNVNIIGGDFTINEGRTLTFAGQTGQWQVSASADFGINGTGTMAMNFNTFSINSAITWETGTLNQIGGTLTINAPVSVKAYDMSDGSLIISKKLSIQNNVVFNGELSGSGELVLAEQANARIGVLNNFGTITVKRGLVDFFRGTDSDDKSLNILNGATGVPAGSFVGLIKIGARVIIGTVNLGNSVLALREELVVNTLNFDNGKVVFLTSVKPLTLTSDTTIWNTTQILTDGEEELSYEIAGQIAPHTETVSPTSGWLSVKDGMTLSFKDVAGTDTSIYHFDSPNLTINIENGAQALFDSASVSFYDLLMTNNGTAKINKGNVTVADKITVGDSGFLIVEATGHIGTDILKAEYGSEVNIKENGTLTVRDLEIKGSQGAWGTLTGAGTLEIVGIPPEAENKGSAIFRGRIVNLGNLVVDFANARFEGQTGHADTIGTMSVLNGGSVTLTHGTLTLDSLTLSDGNILLDGEDTVLALKQNPLSDPNITGTISGVGSLELLNDTSISFGGASEYLGGLRIGKGTATIEAETTLGSVMFTDTSAGKLQINSGATLLISDSNKTTCSRSDNCRVMSNRNNIIQGQGTLHLINGNGSVFNGMVNLNGLQFDGDGTITFGYTSTSQITNFSVRAEGSTVVVNDGTLQINGDFGNANTIVYGTGRVILMGLNDSYIKNNGGDEQSLKNLRIGGGTVNIGGGKFENISFDVAGAGTLNLDASTTVTDNITVGTGNVIRGTEPLVLSGSGSVGSFASTLEDLDALSVENYATANINFSTQVGTGATGLSLGTNGVVNIASGVMLTAENSELGSSTSPSTITGGGTLLSLSSDKTIYSLLSNLNTFRSDGGTVNVANSANISNVVVNGGAVIFNGSSIVGTANVNGASGLSFRAPSTLQTAIIANGSVMNFYGGSIGSASVNGSLAIEEDSTIGTVAFGNIGGTLEIAPTKTLSVTNNISVGMTNTLTGSGTLNLVGTATGTFGMAQNFGGEVKIGHGTAYIRTNAEISKISFNDSTGGVLSIADGYILTIGQINTSGSNRITGAGTLKLTGGVPSVFGSPIDDLGELIVSNGSTAAFNNSSIAISRLSFGNGGGNVNIATGQMTVQNVVQNDLAHIGAIYGAGALVAGSGNVALSTGGNNLASATIGNGILNFVGDSVIGSLRYSTTEGTINIADSVTVTVGSDFSGIGILTGHETSVLQLAGSASAVFSKANEYAGTIIAGSGSLRFLTDTDFKRLALNGTSALFDRRATIDEMAITSGTATFNQVANIDTVTMQQGNVYFNDTAVLGGMNIGSGKVAFARDSSATGGSVSDNGTLSLDVNKLTIDTGNFAFNNNSVFEMRISRTATDNQGNVNASGYGRLVMNGGTLNIGSNVNLNMTIDYGVKTAENGSVFKLVDGNKTGFFLFSNNRYSLTEETCEGGIGICYRLNQTSSAGHYTQEETGNTNQVDTATAFLDGELFEYGTPIFSVAERLDALSQKGQSSEFLNALTALAPDVTSAMSQQPIALQSKISNTLSGRMNGLMGNLGSSSRTYQSIQKMYGRSGGSPYRTRFMRSSDYYRRAGYYDQDDKPVPKARPAYQHRIDRGSPEEVETTTERKRWAKRNPNYSNPKEFGMWAQAFYNKTGYKSTSKPEGFSGDTTGFAFGGDVQLFDVFALGIGYASTSSTVDTLRRSTDVSGSSFFLYGMYKPTEWFISSVLNMASMSYEERKNVAGISVNDKYDGSSFGASVMVGKDLKNWTPAVGLRYVSSKRDSHQDGIGQKIAEISASVTTLVAEARMNKELAKSDSSYWHSELSAAVTYDLSSASEDASVNLPNGSSYTVKGDDFSNMGVELGATLSWIYGEHVDVSAGYNLEWRPSYLSHTLMATFRYTF